MALSLAYVSEQHVLRAEDYSSWDGASVLDFQDGINLAAHPEISEVRHRLHTATPAKERLLTATECGIDLSPVVRTSSQSTFVQNVRAPGEDFDFAAGEYLIQSLTN